jgi:hypothetical protein
MSKIPEKVRRELSERSGGRCEVVIDGIRCSRPAVCPHHKKSKARGGSDNLSNLTDTCFTHHRAIHDHKGEWTKQYRIHSWERER